MWTDDGAPAWSRQMRTALVLLVAALPVYFLFLGANSIWDANEAFYVDTPRQMVQSGDYITPVFNGQHRLNKPVLSYWVVAGMYNLFGVSVTVERVGIAMGAIGIIAATFFVGVALRSTLVGLLAAMMVATAPRMVMFSRRIFIDIYITMFMAAALACFVMAERQPDRRRRWLIAMYVAIGCGVLTKGPVALFFPVVAVAIWIVLERRWADVRRMSIFAGASIVAAIVAPWYVALYIEHGWTPIVQFFVGENFGRYTGEMASEGRGVLFYLPVLFGDLFPWAPLLLIPITSAWRPAVPREEPQHAAIRRLLWIWIVAIAGVFSLSQSKQDLYIFPVVPAVAALVADTLVSARFGRDDRRIVWILGVVAALTGILGVAAYVLFARGYYALSGATVTAVVCVAGAIGVFAWLVARRPRNAVYTLAGTFIVFNYVFVSSVLPSTERLKPSVPLAAVIRDKAGADGHLAAYHLLFPSLVHYVGRPIEELGYPEQVQDLFSRAGQAGAWVVMSGGSYDTFREVIPGLCVADRRGLFEAKLSDLLARRPPSEVVLVTNRCE
jgi:4-amino-4-deoxy-L-arabinose transferase-like glycosyltransferase